jgi:hypothetical protein
VLKNVNKIDEFAVHSSISNLEYAEIIRGFDPYNIFRQHLQTLGLDDCFFKKHLPENRDSGGNAPASDVDDLDTVQSCTKLYTQQGKGPGDKSVQSKITLQKVRHPGASLQRPTTTTKKLRVLQTEEEITTLLTLKLIVLTSFQ